jgi:hypothetical protein
MDIQEGDQGDPGLSDDSHDVMIANGPTRGGNVAAVPIHGRLRALGFLPIGDHRSHPVLDAETPASDTVDTSLSAEGVLAAVPNGGCPAGNRAGDCAYSVYMVDTRYVAVQA